MNRNAVEELERAVISLNKSISTFPIGAISTYNLKPTEERIRDMRDELKAMSAKIIMLKAMTEAPFSDIGEENGSDIYDNIRENAAQYMINDLAIETCLQSTSIEHILNQSGDRELGGTLGNLMEKLFYLNDKIICAEEAKAKAFETEIEWKSALQKSLLEFRNFLKDQKEMREKKLHETNPEIAQQKETIWKRVQKINIMKRLLTTLNAVSAEVVENNPELMEMWRKHRELINIEMIQDMAKEQDDTS